MSTRDVQVTIGDGSWNTRVVVDGVDISAAITGVSMSAQTAMWPPTVTVTLGGIRAMASGPMVVALDQDQAKALEALGWTPPGGAR